MRQIFFKDKDDRMVWNPSKSGAYTVKDGLKVLSNQDLIPQPRKFSFCWNDCGLQKAGAFVWLTLKDRILTSDRLALPKNCHTFQLHSMQLMHLNFRSSPLTM
ncbi:hypothetical protein SUGI_0084470 [Cryptomeria japonica]|nr:hypothetical protein SUGI_0084470 [Cryptomeria japonica]